MKTVSRSLVLICMNLLLLPLAYSASTTPSSAETDPAQAKPAALSLLRIVEWAKQSDAEYQKALNQLAANSEILAKGKAVLRPTVGVEASSTYSNTNALDNNAADSHGTGEVYALQVSQPLFSVSNWRTYQKSKAQFSQVEYQQLQVEQALLQRTVTHILAVLRAEAEVERAAAQQEAVTKQLKQTQQRYNTGLIPITDQHEAQAALDTAVADLLAAQNQRQLAEQALKSLTHQSLSAAQLPRLRSGTLFTGPEPRDPQIWLTQAMTDNPNLLIAKAQRTESEVDRDAARRVYIPEVQLIGRYARDQGYQSGFDFPDQDISSIGVKASLTLYQGGLLQSAKRETAKNLEASQAEVAFQTTQIEEQVMNLYNSLLTDVKRIEAQQQAIRSAQSALTATQSSYAAGNRDIVNVLQAQQAYFAAQKAYANVRYDYLEHWLALNQQAGTLNQAMLTQMNGWFE